MLFVVCAGYPSNTNFLRSKRKQRRSNGSISLHIKSPCVYIGYILDHWHCTGETMHTTTASYTHSTQIVHRHPFFFLRNMHKHAFHLTRKRNPNGADQKKKAIVSDPFLSIKLWDMRTYFFIFSWFCPPPCKNELFLLSMNFTLYHATNRPHESQSSPGPIADICPYVTVLSTEVSSYSLFYSIPQ